MIKNLKSLKKSEFIQSLSEKLSEKKIEIENISTVSGSTTVRGRPMLRYIIVLSDSQEVDLLIDRKTGTIEYASIDDKTVQDFDDVNEEKMPKFLAEHIIKRSAVKVKQELFKNIDVEKFGNATENRDEKKIEDLKAEIEAKKTSIADLKSKLTTTDDVDTDSVSFSNVRIKDHDIDRLSDDGFTVFDDRIEYKRKVVAKYNEKTEKISIVGAKTVKNPLVEWLLENSMLDSDTSEKLRK